MSQQPAPPTAVHPQPVVAAGATQVLGVAVLAGLALGVADLFLQRTLPYPWADLANSSAVWALAAFLLGAHLRPAPGAAARVGAVLVAVAGAVGLVVAVQAYYVAAVMADLASIGRLTSPSTITWMVLGVVAGALFAVAGAESRGPDPVRAAVALALPTAVLLAEAWLRTGWGGGGTALLTAALGAGVLVTAHDRLVVLQKAALFTVPLVPVCYVALKVSGF